MTNITLQVNRGLDGKFTRLTEMVKDFQTIYLNKMANQLVLYSPVDTGTYITGHHAGTSAVGATRQSTGKDRKQPWEPSAQKGLGNLTADIATLSGNENRVVFSNDTFHSDKVEYEHGYAPYGKTAREHGRMAAEAVAEARNRNGS